MTITGNLVYDIKMEFFTLNEVAIYLRVNIRTVERWLNKGSLKGYKLGSGRTSLWRIRKKEVEKFLVATKKKQNGK